MHGFAVPVIILLYINQFKMKRILFLVAFIATAFVQQNFAQENTKTTSSQLLNAYYQLKDNLVKSNAAAATASAAVLVQAINDTDTQILKDDARANLLRDASAIAQSGDIKIQRVKFSTLSDNMFELAKSVKLSTEPVYQQYCPMKKASWLSNDRAIKNPYYGSAMLTCGSVKATL
ncbi:MAG: hypothetical protein JWP81_456 [Ferruginibacter sp.]|nr:hypothetical protein [Ferruginibacter sp.]